MKIVGMPDIYPLKPKFNNFILQINLCIFKVFASTFLLAQEIDQKLSHDHQSIAVEMLDMPGLD